MKSANGGRTRKLEFRHQEEIARVRADLRKPRTESELGSLRVERERQGRRGIEK